MKVIRNARWFVVGGLALIALAVLPQAWVQAAGLDVWNLPKLKAEIVENERASAAMDDEARVLAHRIAAKDRLVKDLVEGRTDLATVTNQFEAMNTNDPELVEHLRDYYHIEDPRELSALNVMAFAETYLDGVEQSGKKPRVMHRLDREFDLLFPE